MKPISSLIYILFIALFLHVKDFYVEYIADSPISFNAKDIFIQSAHGSGHGGDASPKEEGTPKLTKSAEIKKNEDSKVLNETKNNLVESTTNSQAKENALSPYTAEELKLLQQLAERRTVIEKREKDLDLKMSVITASEANLEKKIEELKVLKNEIIYQINQRKKIQNETILSLVKIYENMKPKDAAGILEKLDMPLLLDILRQMKEAKVSPILALMNPVIAKEVSTEFAKDKLSQ